MARIIKFRGKVIENASCYKIGDWAIGDLIHAPDLGTVITTPHDGSLEWSGIVDENTIGQFTGLYDKNGKEIYEGDVVKQNFRASGNDYNGSYEITGFHQGAVKILPSKGTVISPCITTFDEDSSDFQKPRKQWGVNVVQYRCELIGNIHEAQTSEATSCK